MREGKLPYLQQWTERTGKVRSYVRDIEGSRRVPINAGPGTTEFMEGYRLGLLLGLPFLPNARREYLRVMHRPAAHGWEHWQVSRDAGRNWRRIRRTNCVTVTIQTVKKDRL
jgi:hypothetical protein